MNTFSANSLKLLDSSVDDFINKYILHLDFINKSDLAKSGEKLHGFISYYLKGFCTKNIKIALNEKEKETIEKVLKLEIFKEKEKFIKTEESFLVKCAGDKFSFYLTGRFDAIYKNNDSYTIFDWKSRNIPKDPQNELQSIVYLYCASEIFKSKNISIKYLSLETQELCEAKFDDKDKYLNKIHGIVEKMPLKYLT